MDELKNIRDILPFGDHKIEDPGKELDDLDPIEDEDWYDDDFLDDEDFEEDLYDDEDDDEDFDD